MATDPDARKVPINYEGGTIVMTYGMAKNLFSDDSQYISPEAEDKSVSVKAHTRTRVIGGASTPVSGYSYTFKSWPNLPGGNSSGGEAILMTWDGTDSWWTARLHGSASDLGSFLDKESPRGVLFKTERGTTYGPFVRTNV
jgi:hypothetical protein